VRSPWRSIRALEKRLDAADAADHRLWAAYAPTLQAVFQPFYQNPPSLTQPLTGWQGVISLVLPLYDGGYRYGLEQEREAAVHDAEARVEAALRQASSEVRTAVDAVDRAARAQVAAAESSKLAKEALDLANFAYHAGATTNLEVIDAEGRALAAETARAVADDAVRQSRLDLLIASGRFP
jgi:outer membrane protein TolC